MTEETGMGFDNTTEFPKQLTTKPSRKKRSSTKESKEKVEEVSIEKEIVEEVAEYEPPAPSAPTPPSPAVATREPWKPLVRPMRKSSNSSGPSRGMMRRTR